VSTATTSRPKARRFPLHGSALAGCVILGVLILLALLAPWLAPHDPESVDAHSILASPNLSHLFGSDALGRDVFSRTMYALRVSLVVAISSVLLAAVVAVPLGALAGFFGGWVDTLISRPLDMLLVLPALLLAISLISVIGPGSAVAALAIAIIYLPILARVMRSSSLTTSRLGYVEGASSRGSHPIKTIAGHVVPNSISPIIVQVTILAAFALQIEAALSFLGLGTQPPTPSLGLMLADGREALVLAPWVEIFPGLVLALAVMSFILIGDGLRDWLIPRGARQ
jgi:peptide/nickel transport system permease protein